MAFVKRNFRWERYENCIFGYESSLFDNNSISDTKWKTKMFYKFRDIFRIKLLSLVIYVSDICIYIPGVYCI